MVGRGRGCVWVSSSYGRCSSWNIHVNSIHIRICGRYQECVDRDYSYRHVHVAPCLVAAKGCTKLRIGL